MPDLESTYEETTGTSLEERVENNEKKISSIKRILQTKKINTKKLIPSSEQSEQVTNFFVSTLAPALQSIQDNLEKVLKVNHDQLILDAEKQRDDKRIAQQQRKRKREEDSESFGKKAKGLAQRVFKPVISFFDKIIKFFSSILLGTAVIKLLQFLKDPGAFFRPIIDWINGVIEGINNVTKWIVTSIGGGINVIITTINQSLNWVEKRIGDAIRLFDKDYKDPSIADIPTLNLEEFLDNYLTIPYVPGGTPRPEEEDNKTQERSNKGTDSVDAKLTPGEFVMSKGAVDKFGPDFMAGINAAGGGNNKPTTRDGVVYADTGGWINPLGSKGSYKGAVGQRMGDLRNYGGHNGIDLTENWPWGDNPEIPVYAMRDGKVIQGGAPDYYPYTASGENANMSINHGEGLVATYMHMLPGLKPGDKVVRGQQIGRLLDMGKFPGKSSDDTHLHLEMYKDKVIMNPLPLLPPSARQDRDISPFPDPPPKPEPIGKNNISSAAQVSPPGPVNRKSSNVVIPASSGKKSADLGSATTALKAGIPRFSSNDDLNRCIWMARQLFRMMGI